jgi:hypothetical protein
MTAEDRIQELIIAGRKTQKTVDEAMVALDEAAEEGCMLILEIRRLVSAIRQHKEDSQVLGVNPFAHDYDHELWQSIGDDNAQH